MRKLKNKVAIITGASTFFASSCNIFIFKPILITQRVKYINSNEKFYIMPVGEIVANNRC